MRIICMLSCRYLISPAAAGPERTGYASDFVDRLCVAHADLRRRQGRTTVNHRGDRREFRYLEDSSDEGGQQARTAGVPRYGPRQGRRHQTGPSSGADRRRGGRARDRRRPGRAGMSRRPRVLSHSRMLRPSRRAAQGDAGVLGDPRWLHPGRYSGATRETRQPFGYHRRVGMTRHAAGDSSNDPNSRERPLLDPVCGMTVTEKSPHQLMNGGVTVYFCCAGCKDKFAANRGKHASPPVAQLIMPRREPTAPEAEGTSYTCPMHPEVRQAHPGICPKCGMMLEPELPSLEEGENPELTDFRRRFVWTLPLTVAVTVLAMAGERLHGFGMATQSWIELVLSCPWCCGRESRFSSGAFSRCCIAARICGRSSGSEPPPRSSSAMSSRWPATASTTPLLSPRPTWVWRWGANEYEFVIGCLQRAAAAQGVTRGAEQGVAVVCPRQCFE